MDQTAFVDAERFFQELVSGLRSGIPEIGSKVDVAERFRLLWEEHLQFRSAVDAVVRACVRLEEAVEVRLKPAAQRQLVLRALASLSLLRDRQEGRAPLIRIALSGDATPQAIVQLLALRLWESDPWPRVWMAKCSQNWDEMLGPPREQEITDQPASGAG